MLIPKMEQLWGAVLIAGCWSLFGGSVASLEACTQVSATSGHLMLQTQLTFVRLRGRLSQAGRQGRL